MNLILHTPRKYRIHVMNDLFNEQCIVQYFYFTNKVTTGELTVLYSTVISTFYSVETINPSRFFIKLLFQTFRISKAASSNSHHYNDLWNRHLIRTVAVSQVNSVGSCEMEGWGHPSGPKLIWICGNILDWKRLMAGYSTLCYGLIE